MREGLSVTHIPFVTAGIATRVVKDNNVSKQGEDYIGHHGGFRLGSSFSST